MPYFSRLQRASFGGIEFLAESVEVVGGLRDHVHEYPHADGGAPEKMGRKLYTVRFGANFQATLKKWPNLYPRALQELRRAFEAAITSDLVIPTIGTMKAYAMGWSQSADVHTLSGERAVLEFREDQSEKFLVSSLLAAGPTNITNRKNDFEAKAILAALSDPKAQSIFSAIEDATNSVLAYIDTTNAVANVLSAKLLAAIDLCNQADRLASFKDPRNHVLIEALHELWAALLDASKDVMARHKSVQTYVVPAPMSMTDVSKAIYGDNSHAIELLQLNAIVDAFRVPRDTSIRYYAIA